MKIDETVQQRAASAPHKPTSKIFSAIRSHHQQHSLAVMALPACMEDLRKTSGPSPTRSWFPHC
ncbi:uncharacterized protein TrAFT101_001818 [Trichoderma asperellum]|uniref:uncharacterized protein n=1 Tax=Trichoderma asperellum TaxID=101201 RepID=UPI0033235697|nr:hypothetical protein TrAFT101_001818 [Trichoderma asperellum]